MSIKLQNKNGDLSAYGLSCGYVECYRAPRSEAINVNLFKEHGVYHVRAHNHDTGNRLCWMSFRHLIPARRIYNKVKKELKNSPIENLQETNCLQYT